jgi:diguanylate cyclase (GGDEF)-like protein
VTGDVLVPVLITFLIVNVILLIRVGVKRLLERRGAAEPGQPPEPPTTAEPAKAAATGLGTAAGTVAPDAVDVQSARAKVGYDELTGLDDEATWDRRLADESARVKRYPRPVTIVRLELDGLESLTGFLGDDAGDRLLRAMADTLRRLARDPDHVARLADGGFGVLMPETSEDEAVGYVERVSRASELWLESGAVAVRLAIGWAATSGDVGLDEIQRLAADRMRRGDWRDIRRAVTAAGQDAAAREARRPPVAGVVFAADPRLEWERCRDPSCDHKRDHRRDRSR